jgi:hypothetical protein
MIKVGDSNYNTNGTKYTVVEYNNALDILIRFEDEYGFIKKTSYSYFKNGDIRNPYDKTVYNIGFLGDGKYLPYNRNKKKISIIYEYWIKMIQRCYDNKYHEENPTYEKVTTCKEWHNFQNFSDWFIKNYYEVQGERMNLDKDILHKGNKIYSPETCVFVPNRINTLFTKREGCRGDYPIGVTINKRTNKFISRCNVYNYKLNKQIREYLGTHDTPEKAFFAYKYFKEKHIKEVADYYKDTIPKKLYDAMYKYKVEITD